MNVEASFWQRPRFFYPQLSIWVAFLPFSLPFCLFPPLLRAVANTSSAYYPHRLHQIVRRLALLIHVPPSSLAYLRYDIVVASIAAINTVVAGIEL